MSSRIVKSLLISIIMGRTSWHEKADEATKIEISWLKKQGRIYNTKFFESGTVRWTHSFTGNKSSVSYSVSTNDVGMKRMRLEYTITDRYSGEKRKIDYIVPLSTTPCYFGNVRYWFVCPCSVGGRYCGKRVGILYLSGDYFACRHCGNFTYASRCVSERFRLFDRLFREDELREKIKRPYYNGKPTRKMRSFLRWSLSGF